VKEWGGGLGKTSLPKVETTTKTKLKTIEDKRQTPNHRRQRQKTNSRPWKTKDKLQTIEDKDKRQNSRP
jgi:hypothetical protein